MQDLQAESYKALMKEIKDLIKWEDIPCLWIQRLSIDKTAILFKLTYTFNTISIKNPVGLLQNK